MKNGWYAVDLDGTLAHYEGWQGEDHIGDPLPAMAKRVKKWLKEGRDVRIFTARCYLSEASGAEAVMDAIRDVDRIISIIQDWTEKHFGVRLPVTNVKDFGMVELWDDRAMQVIPNQGTPLTSEISRLNREIFRLKKLLEKENK